MVIVLVVLAGLLPVLARSWRGLAVLSLLPAGLISALSALVVIEMNAPGNNASFGAAFLLGGVWITAALLAALTAMRALGLKLEARGKSRLGVIWLDALGILLAVVLMISPALSLQHIVLRPPPADCTALPATLGGLRVELPLHAALTLRDTRESRHYLSRPKGLRSACRATRNGTRPIALQEITIRTGRIESCRNENALPFVITMCAEKPWPPTSLRLVDSAMTDGKAYAMDRSSPQDTWRQGLARCAPGGPTLDCSAEAVLPSNIHAFWTFRATPGREAEALAGSQASVIATMRAISEPD